MFKIFAVSLLFLFLSHPLLAQDSCVDYADFPNLEANVTQLGSAKSTIAQGQHLFVASYSHGLQIVDISNPNAPVKVGSFPTPGQGHGVDLAGDLAFLADGSQGLQIINVADPQMPTPVGAINTLGFVRGVIVAGDLAYLASDWGSGGLIIIDVSDPSQPVELGHVPGGGQARDLALYGTHVYLADYGGNIYVYEVSDPALPQLLNTVAMADSPMSLALEGEILVAAVDHAGIQTFGLADPSAPELLGSFQPSTLLNSFPHDVFVQGSTGFCVTNAKEVIVFDLADPTDLRELTALPVPENLESVSVQGDLIFAAMGEDGVQLIQNNGFEFPAPVGALPPGQDFNPGPMSISAGYAFVASDQLVSVRINTPTNPVLAGSAAAGEENHDIDVQGDFAYLMCEPYDQIQIFNVSNPWSPFLLNSLNTAGNSPERLVAVDHFLYSGPHNLDLGVTDIEYPSSALVMNYTDLNQNFTAMAVQGDSLFLGGFSEVKIMDISDRASPHLVGEIDSYRQVQGITVLGDRAYLVSHFHGLDIVDLSQPGNPVIGHFPARYPQQVSVHQNVAYVCDLRAGVYVLDISEETQPVLLGMKRGGCVGSEVVGEHLVVSGSGYLGGVEILPLQCSGLTPAPDIPVNPDLLQLTAHPNPFNPQTRFSFSLNDPASVELTIHDLSGRQVHRLIGGQFYSEGSHQISWNGRNDQGRLLASGKYFGRMTAGRQQSTCPIILLK